MADMENRVVTLTQDIKKEDGSTERIKIFPQTVGEAITIEGKTLAEKLKEKVDKFGKVPGTAEPQDFHLPYHAEFIPEPDKVKLKVYTVAPDLEGDARYNPYNFELNPVTATTAGIVKAPSTTEDAVLKFSGGQVIWGSTSAAANQRVSIGDGPDTFGEDVTVNFKEGSGIKLTADTSANTVEVKSELYATDGTPAEPGTVAPVDANAILGQLLPALPTTNTNDVTSYTLVYTPGTGFTWRAVTTRSSSDKCDTGTADDMKLTI